MKIKALLKKELLEILRTYKIYVIPVIFLFFGLLSPITAKIMPDLLKSMAGEFKIELPPSTWHDSYGQFFKNLNQIGLLAVILTTMGTVADEKARGTALLVLARPISRHAFILSKWMGNITLLIFSIASSYVACTYYTYVLFPQTNVGASLEATLLFLIYAVFISSLTIFASSITASNIGAGGIAIAGFFVTSILPSLHKSFAKYSPGALTALEMKIINGSATIGSASWAIIITTILSVALVTLGSYIFSKQEL